MKVCDDESAYFRWVMKLFATPSRLVLITGAVLIGTMGFVAGIIGILHWRERVHCLRLLSHLGQDGFAAKYLSI